MMEATMGSALGSTALKSTKGAHPSVRLDRFMKETDPGYQHAEARTQGDHFVRKMATYGQIRPSPSFTNESRVTRPVNVDSALDMSNLPPPWMDPRGEDKEGTFSFAPPPTEIQNDYVKCFDNHSLMLPSERRREHEFMKAGEKKWRQDRKDAFAYGKRMKLLDREHQNGIIGIDSPMLPDTKLYAQRRGYFMIQEDTQTQRANARHEMLAEKAKAHDATAGRQYGEPHDLARSQEIPLPRKKCDPKHHPHRYLDTHSRLFPQHAPTWDPERAAVIRSHDVRHRKHNIINQSENDLELKVAPNFDNGPPDLLSNKPHAALTAHLPSANMGPSHPRFADTVPDSMPASSRSAASQPWADMDPLAMR